MRTDTQLGIASGSKALTALVVMSLADLHHFWQALFTSRTVTASTGRAGTTRFWLPGTGPRAQLVREDAGVSFQSRHDPQAELTWTRLSETPGGPSS